MQEEVEEARSRGKEMPEEAPMRRWALVLGVLAACLFAGSAAAAPGDLIVKRVADINPGAGNAIPTDITDVNGAVFFRADDGIHGTELWRSDGSTATMVADIKPAPGTGSSPSELTNVNGTLYFVANDGTNGAELWKSSGVGATMVANIKPGASGSGPYGLTDFNGTLYFAADDGTNGVELWKSNGGPLGPGGTEMAANINPAGASSNPGGLTPVNGTLFFGADDGTNGEELWKSDGSTAAMVADINPTAGTGSSPGRLASADGKLFFAADDGTNGNEPWVSNGGALGSGTAMVADLVPGDGSNPRDFTDAGGTVFFQAGSPANGNELFKTTAPYTTASMVDDINPSGHSEPQSLTELGGILYFAADDGVHGEELWRSNGGTILAGGTALVADINPALGTGGFPDPSLIVKVDGRLFLPANDGVHGLEMWTSNGGPIGSGTSMVADINPNPGDPAISDSLGSAGGALYFSATDGSTGLELWRTAIEGAGPPAPPPPATGVATGRRAAALKKCKKKPAGKKRAKCKRKAKRLPV